MLMHRCKKIQTSWRILIFVMTYLGWQNHAIASNQCFTTDSGIYGEAKLGIKSGVTVNGYNVDSGDTTDNSINSIGVINNPSITLTSMGSVAFGTTDIDVNNNDVMSPGSYGGVKVEENAHIRMEAGDYYIDYFDVKKNVEIILLGPVTIHVGKFDLDDNVQMNGPYTSTNPVISSGVAANLTVKWYGGGTQDNKFHLHDNTKFTGIIYSTGVGGSEGVKFHNNAKFFGGIFTDNIIKIGVNTKITYGIHEQAAAYAVLGDSALNGAVKFGACIASLEVQAGRATLENTTSSPGFTSVCFDKPFSEVPRVFSLPTTAADDDRLALRIRNVTTTGFDIAQVEPPITSEENLPDPSGNISQTIDFLAIPEGDYDLDDGAKMRVSSLSTKAFQGKKADGIQSWLPILPSVLGLGTQSWVTISTSDLGFSQTPAIIASIQTMNNETTPFPISTPFLATTVKNVDDTEFMIALERGETDSDSLGKNETIGFIAIAPGSGELTDDINYQSFRTNDDIRGDNTCQVFNLNAHNGTPLVIASQNTRKESNGGWLKRCSITTSSAGFSIVEDQANDAEGDHIGEQAGGIALGGAFTDMTCNTVNLHHYRIEHDTQGFTCEAETLTIKACADINCDTLYDQETSITLSPSGWAGSDTIVFTGETTTTLSKTDKGTVTLAKTSATPDAALRCFNGNTETCDITFSNDGFELYGENNGEPLPDQLAANKFKHVNLRAVRSNNNVCEALLTGTQTVDLTYNCILPNECVTPFSKIAIDGNGLGDNTGTLRVAFNAQGVANLSGLNYPDAGRLTLSVAAEVEGVTITDSDNEAIDVYPSYLQLAVDQNNNIAAEPFTLSIGAYGKNNKLLPNYKAGASELKIRRLTPSSIDANDGNFKYGDASTSIMTTNLSATFAATFPFPLVFSDGVYSSTQAYYDDVGSVEIDIQDVNYLGNIIPSQGALTLGTFIPAYFSVTKTQPELQDTCEDTFSYVGETIGFVAGSEPLLIFTGKNALDAVTENYGASPWTFNLSQSDVNNGIYLSDNSTYAAVDSFNEISKGSIPIITTGNVVYDGIIEVQIPETSFTYNKTRSNNTTFGVASPFTASIDMVFSSTFLSDEDGVCYQHDYANGACLSFTIPNITGANLRYGRLVLESTYGPETESLNVPVKAEYFDDNNQWLINSEDNCTNINFLETEGDMILESTGGVDITADIDNISSDGLLLNGVTSDSSDFLLVNSGNKIGSVKLKLSPTASGVVWPTHLNYDWDGDGLIDIDDFPEATITFGQFRGNDRIIQWREVFN